MQRDELHHLLKEQMRLLVFLRQKLSELMMEDQDDGPGLDLDCALENLASAASHLEG